MEFLYWLSNIYNNVYTFVSIYRSTLLYLNIICTLKALCTQPQRFNKMLCGLGYQRSIQLSSS